MIKKQNNTELESAKMKRNYARGNLEDQVRVLSKAINKLIGETTDNLYKPTIHEMREDEAIEELLFQSETLDAVTLELRNVFGLVHSKQELVKSPTQKDW